jgi:Sulfatase-modifying factor enzyme 1
MIPQSVSPRRDALWPLLMAAAIGLALAAIVMWPQPRQPPVAKPATTSLVSATASVSSAAPNPPAPSTPAPDPVAADDAMCPLGMVLVTARYCPFVAHRCLEWIGPAPRRRRDRAEARCARFEDRLLCEGRPSEHAFCVDRYEYPNVVGMKPAVVVSHHDAERACAEEGKRLCGADEWRLACEGAATRPYATGLTREPSLCNLDRRPRRADPVALAEPHDVSVEMERLDQRMPSGALKECVSTFGIFDMTGNVAEWVTDRAADKRKEFPTAIAGGHWGRSPATCRALDHRHDGSYRHHDLGFRCCADALDGRDARRLMPKSFRLPKRRAIEPP